MDSRGIELQVAALAGPLAEKMGLSLLDTELSYETGDWYLRLYIEKPGGVGIEDCAKLSEAVDEELERKDPIPQAYILEVTSSGEKPLRYLDEYTKFIGRNVLVTTYKQVNGKKRFEGTLKGLIEGNVVIEDKGTEASIPLEMVSKARLAFKF